MHILMDRLYDELDKYCKIFIYGAGNYAKTVYPLLKRAGLQERIVSFVVSGRCETGDIDGIKIKSVCQINWESENSVVLIAVNGEYENEIAQTLHEYQVVTVLKLTDYMVFEEMLKNCSDKQFLEFIIEHYIWNSLNSFREYKDRKKEILLRLTSRDEENIDRKTIVYICGDLKPRSVRIVGALQRKNFNVIVLLFPSTLNDFLINELSSLNVKVFFCKNMMDIYDQAIQYNPLIYYLEPVWGDCGSSEVIIRHRNLYGKIVFAPYDVLNDGYAYVSKKQKAEERYCLENADGIVWRWFSKEFLVQKKNFTYRGKSIQFLDYCDNYNVQFKKGDDILKLCYVGGSAAEFIDEDKYINTGDYAQFARLDNVMRKIGHRKDCVFHVYTGICTKENKEKNDLLEREYPNYKVFYGTAHDELIAKIAINTAIAKPATTLLALGRCADFSLFV